MDSYGLAYFVKHLNTNPRSSFPTTTSTESCKFGSMISCLADDNTFWHLASMYNFSISVENLSSSSEVTSFNSSSTSAILAFKSCCA
uniref:Uncharacterized protein n=1 Tax=Romanomermis culicivorax TaxID=13658 RepID=A0A915I8J0_ROMCU